MRSRWASSSFLSLQLRQSLVQFGLDPADGPFHPFGTRHVVGGGEHVDLGVLGDDLARDRVQRHESLDVVAEHLDADRVLLVDREHLDRVAADSERAALEGDVVARVLDVDEGTQERVAVERLTHAQPNHSVDVLLRRPEAVDGGHGRDAR